MKAPDIAVAPPGRDAAWPWAGLVTVAYLGVVAGVQMSDRGLHAILSPAIRQAFGVGDAAMGALHGVAGILIASGLAVPLAKLSDVYSRKRILLALIATWAGLTVLGALAPSFPWLFAGWAAAGITEFAMIPVVYSMIPDLVGERLRVGANLAFAALMATGASTGFYLGGHLLELAAQLDFGGPWAQLEPWRRALLMLAGMAAPLLLLGGTVLDPPRRRDREAVQAGAVSLLAFVRANRLPVALFVGAAGGVAVAVQAVVPMIAMALDRRFAADLATVGNTLGVLILVGNLGSLPTAWALDRALRARMSMRARPAIMGVATAVAVPCAALLAFAPQASSALWLAGGFLFSTCVANALIPTMLQDLAPGELRARAFASYSFLIAGFCALGPLLSGGISQYLLHDDLLTAISLAAVPVLAVTVACTALWCRHDPVAAPAVR
ncbi:MAG: MFS transporter [Pseudoxanthomonas sp.]